MLIGNARAEWRGKPVLVGKRKSLALMCYLATHPTHEASRSHLSELLWPDKTEQKARNSLRQCLSDIRREMPGIDDTLLKLEADTLGLRPLMFATDFDVVLREVSKGKLADALEAHPSVVETLMGGLHGVSNAYDDWIRSVATSFENALGQPPA